jgi:hypothetical protein
MPDKAAYSIVVVCEAEADQRTASALSDRVLCESIDWIAPEVIDRLRRYRGIHDHEPYVKWTKMVEIANKQRIFAHGFISGRPREPDAAMAERALLLLKKATSPLPSAVILLRDADKDGRRRKGYEQARTSGPWPFEVLIGVADTKRECWVLAGYEPRDDAERALLERERKDLGFDPRLSAEQLTASEDGAKRDAKRVLKALTGGDRDREDACLTDLPLAILKQRGAATGLTPYLLEIEDRLVPLFESAPKR